MEDLSWWIIVSTILSVIFLVANVAQLVAYIKEKSLILKEKEIHKSQVKVWQHHAQGIQMGLLVLSVGKFSSVNDLIEGVKSVYQEAGSLYNSLNEERLFSDEEIKERQIQNEKASQERLKLAEQQAENKISSNTLYSCPKCGIKHASDSGYCTVCGTKL